MAQKNYRISFCIVCMNRLHQLKETLLQNIRDNSGYNELEFILLDYNSLDGMEKWVIESLSDLIQSGRITYYRTPDPQIFSHSHSKNMAFKLATGEIICNINADHFTGPDFANYINKQFNIDSSIVITPIDPLKTDKDIQPPRDVMGKVCVKKSDFYSVTGFDENFKNYGFEDYDFINRLHVAGLKISLLKNPLFLEFISHTNQERYTTNYLLDKLDGIYVNYQMPSKSKVLFLYKTARFELDTLVDNSSIDSTDASYAFENRNFRYEFSCVESESISGEWKEDEQYINLSENKFIKEEINGNVSLIKTDDRNIFYQLKDEETIIMISTFIYQHASRSIMERNLANRKIIVNNEYGKGLVYKNFNYEKPISLC